MRSWIRHFLPFALVRASQIRAELIRLGVSPLRASKLALRRSTQARLHHHNLDLLPDRALAAPAGVIDIGANLGDWTATLLSFCQPQQILCAEPDPKLAQLLRERYRKISRIEICETAIGETEGSAELNVMENSVLNSLRTPAQGMAQLFPEEFRRRESVRVKVRSLDALTEKLDAITLLKIDAQGFEREILAGAKQTLTRTDFVLLEMNFQPHYEGEAGFFELDAAMQQNGFCIANYSPPKGGRRQALFADFLYVRK